MIFSINNGDFQIWLPLYIIYSDSYIYKGALLIEALLTVIVLIFTVISGFIILTTTAFHKNFNSLIAIVILSWLFAMVGKILTFPYLIGIIKFENCNLTNPWWTSDVAKMIPLDNFKGAWPLFLGGALTWYYIFMMTTCLFTLAMERTFASFLIKNYENTPRPYLLALLVLFQQFIIFTTTYLIFFNKLQFIPIIIFLEVINTSAMIGFFLNRQYSLKILRLFKKKPEESMRNYTLAVRFQAKENLRVFNVSFWKNFVQKLSLEKLHKFAR